MDRWVRVFKGQNPVEELIDEYAKDTPEDEVAAEAAVMVPDGYKVLKLHQTDGTCVAVGRKIATCQVVHRDSLISSRSSSPTRSFSTVSSCRSDRRSVHDQQPFRDSTSPSTGPSWLSQAGATRRRSSARPSSAYSVSSSMYSEKAERDTMASTMTIVEAALAEQHASQRKGHRRGDGSATTTTSGAALSGASGRIHIGHIKEMNDHGHSSEYLSSACVERQDSRCDDGQTGDDTGSRYRSTYGNCENLHSGDFIQHKLVSINYKDLPSPLSTAYSPGQKITSWSHVDNEMRAYKGQNLQSLPVSRSRTSAPIRQLIQGSSYLVACCSIVLPAMFLVLGIFVTFMNGQAASSRWSTVASVVKIAAAVWPVVFAAVVAQAFKSWILFQSGRWNSKDGQITQSWKLSQRLEAMCVLVVLVWCLAPVGSQALERTYGLTLETPQNSTDVWFVDRTGYNALWSANSTSTMSAATRSELMRIVGERYIGSLAPNTISSDQNGPTTAYSGPALMLLESQDSTPDSKDDPLSPSSLLPTRNLNSNSGLESVAGSFVEVLNFTMITSRFEFTCGDWSLSLREFDNTTSATKMSYSQSQTLGMRMTSGDNSSTPLRFVRFASLNKVSTKNGTNSATRISNETSPRTYEQGEYSSIRCEFEQHFYSQPIQCERKEGINEGACVQSGRPALVLTPTGLSGTELGDFAQDFVSVNIPTIGREPTATERYVQNGGPLNPASLAVKRDEPVLLNLSATVSPDEFAHSFGRLFNTWVSLGYCPQCTSDVLAGNATVIPTNLQQSYRQVTSTTAGVGYQVFTINWPWLTVFLVFAIILLMAGVTSVAVQSIMPAGVASKRSAMEAENDDELCHLQSPKA